MSLFGKPKNPFHTIEKGQEAEKITVAPANPVELGDIAVAGFSEPVAEDVTKLGQTAKDLAPTTDAELTTVVQQEAQAGAQEVTQDQGQNPAA
jgi:hypothetical protein